MDAKSGEVKALTINHNIHGSNPAFSFYIFLRYGNVVKVVLFRALLWHPGGLTWK